MGAGGLRPWRAGKGDWSPGRTGRTFALSACPLRRTDGNYPVYSIGRCPPSGPLPKSKLKTNISSDVRTDGCMDPLMHGWKDKTTD